MNNLLVRAIGRGATVLHGDPCVFGRWRCRIFQLLDPALTKLINYPYLCIAIVGVKHGAGHARLEDLAEGERGIPCSKSIPTPDSVLKP